MSAGLKTQEPTSRGSAKAPEIAAAAAAAGLRPRPRRRQAKMRGHGNVYMDMNVEVGPDWGAPPGGEPVAVTAASDRGAGSLGFAGTARKEAGAQATGLTTLAGDEFGGGPQLPMLPNTWDRGGEPADGREN
jgi:PPE-repeat protein